MTSFTGRTVVVTGAASGIGRLMALGAARRGASVVLWDIQDQPLHRVAAEIEEVGGSACAYRCDVGDRLAVKRVADDVHRDGHRIDVLVNNAGVVAGHRFLDLTDEDIERTFEVNALAHFWTTRAFLPEMIERGSGHIVTIASAVALVPVPGCTDYSASKAAAFAMTEGLRRELSRDAPGVRTTVVCPLLIDTGMFEGAALRHPHLSPVLHEDDVAAAVLEAVEQDHERLYMPAIVRPAATAPVLPARLGDTVLRWLGSDTGMDHFVGRRRAVDAQRSSQTLDQVSEQPITRR